MTSGPISGSQPDRAWRIYAPQPAILRVYVAGAIAIGDALLNVRRAIVVGRCLMKHGLVPYIPHESCFWTLAYHDISREEWLAYDKKWIDVCDALLWDTTRMPGESKGAEHEWYYARERGLPVFHRIETLLEAAGIAQIPEYMIKSEE